MLRKLHYNVTWQIQVQLKYGIQSGSPVNRKNWLEGKSQSAAKCVKHHIKKFTLIMIIKQANFVDGCVTVVTYQLGY
jgi:hypothetical protein